MLVLFTDTDTDITPEVADEYGYRMISMPYTVDDVTHFPYTEGERVFDFHKFYDSLRGGVLPTTSALSKEKYIEIFEPVFANGDDIFYVHFSRAMTMTFDSMDKALEELKAKYPDRKAYFLDTKGITILSYLIAREVGKLFKQGKTPEEVLEWGKTEVDKFAVYFMADDLKFFKHSGRVSGLAAFMGGILGVRPIIFMNDEGKMVSVGTEKGRMKTIERLLKYVDELGDDVASHRIVVGNTDNKELVDLVVARLRERFGEKALIDVVDVNPTAGSHCGPDAVGICFHAIHR